MDYNRADSCAISPSAFLLCQSRSLLELRVTVKIIIMNCDIVLQLETETDNLKLIVFVFMSITMCGYEALYNIKTNNEMKNFKARQEYKICQTTQ